MLEMIKSAKWNDFYDVLSKGNPPLALQFFCVNLVFFLIFTIRRMRGYRTKNTNASFFIHGFLLLVNAGIMFQSDIMPLYQRNILVFWNKLQQVI